jgi:circadian clock protein KaiA
LKPSKPLRICLFHSWQPEDLSSAVWERLFPSHQFALQVFNQEDLFLQTVHQDQENIDCLFFLSLSSKLFDLQKVTHSLCEWGLLLPTVLMLIESPLSQKLNSQIQALQEHRWFFYHNATVVKLLAAEAFPDKDVPVDYHLPSSLLSAQVDRAIALFLQLSPTCGLPQGENAQGDFRSIPERVRAQQQRLAEKLRERLGYMGVYYHRDPDRFYRRLPSLEQQSLMQRLRGLYQAIILEYFQSPQKANARIDEFVALAFFSDLSVSQVLELHMSLMDDFAKQLKLEGRNEEILLDYRITLIDVIAHLSEMYRRSIPRDA